MNNGITPDNMKTKLKDKAKIDNIKMFVYQYVVFHKDQSKVHFFTRTKPLMIIATENTHDTVMNNSITPDNMKTKLKDKAKIDNIKMFVYSMWSSTRINLRSTFSPGPSP